jgi:hypothetical protein
MMGEWDQVRWTEARQIAELMRVDDEAMPAPGVEPQAHYRTLRDGGQRPSAAMYLGHALPRFEAIGWACSILEEEGRERALKPADRRALDVALRWLGDPSDERRRAAQEASDAASAGSAERALGLAVFLSGGSISQPDLAPVLPPPEAAGAAAAGAIVIAAYRSDDPEAVLDRALDLGEKLAAQGTRALKEA